MQQRKLKPKIFSFLFFGLCAQVYLATAAFAQEIPFDPNEQPTGAFQMAPPKEQPASPPADQKFPTNARPKGTAGAELGALGTLAPFSDVAVIQKRFLPKTKRFEIFPNIGLILNDAFFTNTIMGGRLGYYFREKWGVEATALIIGTSNKEVTRRLAEDLPRGLQVQTRNLVSPQAFYGLGVKWAPIYGKLGFLDSGIVPFDMYFLLGGGVTKTNQDSSPATLQIGTGQIFAIKKWLAFRWDITNYWYKADTRDGSRPGGTYNNLHVNLGLSIFFPGAEYR